MGTPLELLASARREYLNKYPLPRPPESFPANGLPEWKRMPLDARIPVVWDSEDKIILTRRKLGQSLLKTFPGKDFNIPDPSNRYTPTEYCSLHDPDLRHYFNNPLHLKMLRKQGLITKDGRVKCSIQDFNKYRVYLRHLHADEISFNRNVAEKNAILARERQQMFLKKIRQGDFDEEDVKKTENLLQKLDKELKAKGRSKKYKRFRDEARRRAEEKNRLIREKTGYLTSFTRFDKEWLQKRMKREEAEAERSRVLQEYFNKSEKRVQVLAEREKKSFEEKKAKYDLVWERRLKEQLKRQKVQDDLMKQDMETKQKNIERRETAWAKEREMDLKKREMKKKKRLRELKTGSSKWRSYIEDTESDSYSVDLSTASTYSNTSTEEKNETSSDDAAAAVSPSPTQEKKEAKEGINTDAE